METNTVNPTCSPAYYLEVFQAMAGRGGNKVEPSRIPESLRRQKWLKFKTGYQRGESCAENYGDVQRVTWSIRYRNDQANAHEETIQGQRKNHPKR